MNGVEEMLADVQQELQPRMARFDERLVRVWVCEIDRANAKPAFVSESDFQLSSFIYVKTKPMQLWAIGLGEGVGLARK